LLQERALTHQRASTWLIVADELEPEEEALLRDAERRGRAVVVLLTGEQRTRSTVRALHAPYQEGWSGCDALTLAE
jgi:hypothetical protein